MGQGVVSMPQPSEDFYIVASEVFQVAGNLV
jgi:hypothetical protein